MSHSRRAGSIFARALSGMSPKDAGGCCRIEFGTRAAALERLVPRRLAPTSRKMSDFSWHEIPHLKFYATESCLSTPVSDSGRSIPCANSGAARPTGESGCASARTRSRRPRANLNPGLPAQSVQYSERLIAEFGPDFDTRLKDEGASVIRTGFRIFFVSTYT